MVKKKIILVGAGGSGKDYMAQYLVNRGFKRNIAYTTRPSREGEVDGEDYYFIMTDDFEGRIQENYWHEYNMFIPEKKWYYGSSRKQYEECDVFLKEPRGVSLLSEEEREECIVVYINIDEDIRRKRMSGRKKNYDDVERRINADRIDFENFTDYDIEITDENFSCPDILKKIEEYGNIL